MASPRGPSMGVLDSCVPFLPSPSWSPPSGCTSRARDHGKSFALRDAVGSCRTQQPARGEGTAAPGPGSHGATGALPAGERGGTATQHANTHAYRRPGTRSSAGTQGTAQTNILIPLPSPAAPHAPLVGTLEANVSFNINPSSRTMRRAGPDHRRRFCEGSEKMSHESTVGAGSLSSAPLVVALRNRYKMRPLRCLPPQQARSHLQTGVNVAGIPTPSQFNPFCRSASSPSMPGRSLVTNYHRRAVTNGWAVLRVPAEELFVR